MVIAFKFYYFYFMKAIYSFVSNSARQLQKIFLTDLKMRASIHILCVFIDHLKVKVLSGSLRSLITLLFILLFTRNGAISEEV